MLIKIAFGDYSIFSPLTGVSFQPDFPQITESRARPFTNTSSTKALTLNPNLRKSVTECLAQMENICKWTSSLVNCNCLLILRSLYRISDHHFGRRLLCNAHAKSRRVRKGLVHLKTSASEKSSDRHNCFQNGYCGIKEPLLL